MTHRTFALVAVLTALPFAAPLGGLALAQAPPVPVPAPPASPPDSAKNAEPPKTDAPKSLDDVLGIPSNGTSGDAAAKDTNDAVPALDKAHDRVEKALDEKALEDLMRQALGGMRVSADRLSKETDSGLGTQRVQQDVIAKLDTLIEEAKKRCKNGESQSGSKSGSQRGNKSGSKSSQSNGDQPKDGEGQKPSDSKSKSAQDGKKPGDNSGASAGGAEPPAVDPVDQGKVLDETRAEWGNLPERVRDLIRQGSRDRIAAIYQRLTEEYYRRMAEDASK